MVFILLQIKILGFLIKKASKLLHLSSGVECNNVITLQCKYFYILPFTIVFQ